MVPQVLKRRFSVHEFHQMAEAGVFDSDNRLELLEGEVVRMTPIGSRHAGCVNRLIALLTRGVGADAIVSVQNPVTFDEHTQLQPDFALLKPRADFYSNSHPRPEDVVFLVEVADASADYDRGVKMPVYARAGIPALWVIDLAERFIDVYAAPAHGSYAEHRRLGPDDVVTLSVPGIPAVTIRVRELVD